MMLRSVLFSVAFYGWTLMLALLGLPLLLIPSAAARHLARFWSDSSLTLLRWICGIRCEVKGREHIVPGPAIYASKHQSAWETLAYWTILPDPMYVLKKELLLLPLIGWYLSKVGNIAIDRGAGAGAMKKMLNRAKAMLQQKHIIVVFPEGTRVAPHETKPFNPGVAALYAQGLAPVVPVAVNSGLCWKRNAFLKTPGTITIQFLPPIQPGLPPREFLTKLEQSINEATKAIGG